MASMVLIFSWVYCILNDISYRVRRISHTLRQTQESQDQDLIRHAYAKIAMQIVSHCQTPHFQLEKHGNSFAAVVCALCQESVLLSDLVRGQFYASCPLGIPLLALEEAADPDAYRAARGFKCTEDDMVLGGDL